MKRLLPLVALAASPAFADEFRINPTVVAATVYPGMARETLQFTQQLSKGHHTLLIPASEYFDGISPDIQPVTEGVSIKRIKYLRDRLADPDAFLTPVQAAAKARLEAAEDKLAEHSRETAAISGRVTALTAQFDFLKSLRTPDEKLSIEDLQNLSDLVLNGSEKVLSQIAQAKAKLDEARDVQEVLEKERAAAEGAWERSLPPLAGGSVWAIEVEVQADTEAQFTQEILRDGLEWGSYYEAHLTSGSHTVRLERKALLIVPEDTNWQDISLTLATNRPGDQTEPSRTYGRRASVFAPVEHDLKAGGYSTPLVEDVIVVEEAASALHPYTDGFSVTYQLSDPISAGPDEVAILDLGAIELPATLENWAAPRYDETAFLMAEVVNSTKEPLINGGLLSYRDGLLVGTGDFDGAVPNQSLLLPFGPIEHLRLEYVQKDNQTGERGILSSDTTREHTSVVRIENLSGTPESIRVFFPTTYSEQEELRVTVNATPAPTETDFEDRRGVSVWDLNVPAGGQSEISIETTLRWPEGKTLSWSP
ncbi:DUF4139 domain-containing protein [uncultured Aliiroseovarius sp.]|uniref:DUF4139 domain-containing protein n=1 Tax=uncultured Aliiroseovarius sp. TaxID=1658783 RepID=UPI00260AFC6A|nr:DUF4139 domain-containing protein [uncultured Aliiroseovarius sp.]